MGGIGSKLGGGNFWMGAAQGLIVTAFNYLSHREAPTTEGDTDESDDEGPIKPKKMIGLKVSEKKSFKEDENYVGINGYTIESYGGNENNFIEGKIFTVVLNSENTRLSGLDIETNIGTGIFGINKSEFS